MQSILNIPTGNDPRSDRILRVVLYFFMGTIAFSVLGTLLLELFPSLLRTFGRWYPTLVKTPTWIYMVLLPVIAILMYLPKLGTKRLLFFLLWGCSVGGGSELLGTSTGIPFGAYHYTQWLGPKILDHVPYFIPFSWFAMSVVSLDLATRISSHRFVRILAGTIFMVLWDVSLDPAMNRAFPFWIYPDGGFFYGMPLSNWAGWFIVSFIIITGYELIGHGLPGTHPWTPFVYFLNCLFPLLISLLYGLVGAVLIGVIATAIPLLTIRRYNSVVGVTSTIRV